MIANIYKPVSWTSFDVVKKLRNIMHEKKVGHGGTLDPFAEGVLIIGTGKDTKSLTDIAACDKTYEATVKIGVGTDTMDREGKIIETAPVPNLTIDQIKKTFAGFLGAQKQTPPMYSAKRIKGVRLYKLARKNQTVHRDPVDINIHALQLISYDSPFLRFSVKCSKGTYVRVHGHDIAKSLGTAGHLTKLIRTSVGEFHVKNSLTIDKFSEQWLSIEA